MGDAVEALFISTGSEDNTTCSVQDLRTGTDLMRYKGGGCAPEAEAGASGRRSSRRGRSRFVSTFINYEFPGFRPVSGH